MNKTFLKVSLVVLVLALVVLIVFYFKSNSSNNTNNTTTLTPTPTVSTIDWVEYKNATDGFSIKYPKDWGTEATADNVLGITVDTYDTVASEPENVKNSLGASTLEELITLNKNITKIGDTKLGSVNATDVIWKDTTNKYIVLAVKNNKLYKVTFHNATDKDSLTTTEKTVLSTFKFL